METVVYYLGMTLWSIALAWGNIAMLLCMYELLAAAYKQHFIGDNNDRHSEANPRNPTGNQ